MHIVFFFLCRIPVIESCLVISVEGVGGSRRGGGGVNPLHPLLDHPPLLYISQYVSSESLVVHKDNTIKITGVVKLPL